MLTAGTVRECLTKPKVLNPLSVSKKGKKRLIWDLWYVNNHLFKDKIKFDVWNSFQNYLEGNKGYLFKFDLKSEYHHIDKSDEHQTYLGFSWEINYKNASFCLYYPIFWTKYCTFCVYQSGPTINLPFGLSTALFVFTKMVQPLIKYSRLHA